MAAAGQTHIAVAGLDIDVDESSLIVPFRTEGREMPIFCVHSPLGSTGYYASLARALPAGVPFYGINAVGAFGDEAPLDSFEAMAERYIREIRAVRPHGPYILAGHSSGAYIAFEMAIRLGLAEVPKCIVLDQDAPSREGLLAAPKTDTPPDMLGVLIRLLAVIATLQQRSLPDDPESMRRAFATAPKDHQFIILAGWLKDLGLLPPNAGAEMAAGFLRSAGAHGTAEAEWTLRGRRYQGQLCVLQAIDSVVLPGYSVAATDPARYADWQLHCTRQMRHFHVGGNHLSLMIAPYVAQTAQCVGTFLREN
jgi:thioesterase domain-containing protein